MTVKISNLPVATSVGSGDVIPVVQSGTTKKIDLNSPWSINIDGGAIDGTPIGASSASTGAFSTLTASGDVNFDSGTLFVDSSANEVGIGTTTPIGKLHIKTGESSAASPLSSANELVLEGSGNTGLTISTPNTAEAGIYFADPQQAFGGYIRYFHSTNTMQFASAGTSRVVIDSTGDVGIGTSSPAKKLDVSGEIRASGGILFGSDTASANTLDDYETGTWTPLLFGSTSGEITDAVYDSFNGASYVKIGQVVYIQGILRLDDKGSIGSSEVVQLGGLPFTQQNNLNAGEDRVVIFAGRCNGVTNGSHFEGFGNATTANLLNLSDTNVIGSEITDSTYITFSGFYMS